MKPFFVIVFLFIPFMISSSFYVFNDDFFRSEFSLYDVDNKFSIDINNYHQQVISYLIGEGSSMPLDLPLTQRELDHMKDVREVFVFALTFYRVVAVLSVLIFSYYSFMDKKKLSNIFFYSGLLSLGIFFLLLLFFVLSFETSFNLFHTLFFEEGTWTFLPTDTIVNVYPEGLFFDIFTRVFLSTVGISLLFILLSKKFIKRLSFRL